MAQEKLISLNLLGSFKDKLDQNGYKPLYGTCATAANTAEKAVVLSDFAGYVSGIEVRVKFTNSNTASNPTLNVNNKGAKVIYRYGSTTPGTTEAESWKAGAIVSFTYDGTNFIMNDVQEGGASTAADVSYDNTSSGMTADDVQEAIDELKGDIDNLPEPMVFKGSLGTGGTITTLPTASAENKGYVYKVITDGTYASQAAKVGDTFISDGSAWVLIPSGDEPSGTVTSVGLSAGDGIGVSGSPITTSGTITVTNTGVRSISSGSVKGTIRVNTNGVNSNVNPEGIFFGIDQQQDGTWSNPTVYDSASVHVYTYSPLPYGFVPGDKVIVFLYNQYQNTTDSQQYYDLNLTFNDDETSYPVYYTGQDGNQLPVIFDTAKSVKLVSGKAYTFTFVRGNMFEEMYFLIDDLFLSPVTFIGTTAQWNDVDNRGHKALYDMAILTDD